MLLIALFWFLAVIHLLPAAVGVLPRQIQAIYGVAPADKTLMTLLQHRALLLGLVGAAFACAAHVESVRPYVLLGGAISMVGFLVIATLNSELTGPLRKIAVIDAIGLPAVAALTYLTA